MRPRNFVPSICSPLRLMLLLAATMLLANPVWAANPVVRDGNTIQLGDTSYRLDGIDAPEFDQICIDAHADAWTCGVEASEQLTKLIGGHQVHCDDLGPDKTHRKRHIGICTAEGDTTSLNQALVRQGFAISRQPSAKGRFERGRDGRQGRPPGPLEGLFRGAARIPAWQKGRRPARRRLPGRQGSRNPQRAVSR